MKNRIATSFPLFGQNLDIGFSLNYTSNEIDRNLPGSMGANTGFHKSEEFQSILSFHYQIRFCERMLTTVNLPLNYYQYSTNNFTTQALKGSKPVMTPSVSNYFTINHLWKVHMQLGYDWNYGDFLFNTASPFLRSHRMTYIPSNHIPTRTSYFIGTGLKFGDLSEMIFLDFNALYRIFQFNYVSKLAHTADRSFYTTESKNNTGRMMLFNTNVSKTFIPAQLVLTLTPTFTQTTSMMIQQDLLINNKSNIASFTFKAELKKIKNIYINYQLAGRMSWQDNNLTDKRIRKDMMQKLTVFYFPQKNIDLSATSEYTLLEMNKDQYATYAFADLKGRYKHKRAEFELAINNILNSSLYSRMSFSSVNSTLQRVPLREREFLFSVILKF